MLAGTTPFIGDCDPGDTVGIAMRITEGEYYLPDSATPESRDLLAGLLHQDPAKRLGALKGGMSDVTRHKFFQNISQTALQKRRLAAPWVPKTDDATDISLNFESIYLEGDDMFHVPYHGKDVVFHF